jgi:FlaA1/EpsC-like NDP-sugar epimerase
LPRRPIDIDMAPVKRQLAGHCVLVTGAAGSIGSEIAVQLAALEPSELILLDQAETPLHDLRLRLAAEFPLLCARTVVTSVTNVHSMQRIFSAHSPEYIFHAAAYKHVPMMEDNPYEAILNNVEGTRIVADLALQHGARRFVMVSTDKAVNPTSVMGCSKRICEIYVQALDRVAWRGDTRFVTTRFGNVLGSNGSVIPLFARQLEQGGPLTVTHPEVYRYFMLIPEACRLVLLAATVGQGGEIFAFDMGEPVNITDLARRMIELYGTGREQIEFTGLRPGEKLREELLTPDETTLPGPHPKIKVARVRRSDFDVASRSVEALVALSRDTHATVEQLKRKMREMVPEYDYA